MTSNRWCIHLPPCRSPPAARPQLPSLGDSSPETGCLRPPMPRASEPRPSDSASFSAPGAPGPRGSAPFRSGLGKGGPGTREWSPVPGTHGNASSPLPGFLLRQAQPEGGRGARPCSRAVQAAPGLPRRRAAGNGRRRPRRQGALLLTVCSCSSARARGSSSSNSAAAAATPGAPGSGLILRAPTGPAPAHLLLLRRRRRRGRFASTGRGQTHGARAQPLAPPRRRRHRPLRSLPRPPRLPASSSDSATSSGHPGTRRKCLATRGRNRRRPPRPGGARPWPLRAARGSGRAARRLPRSAARVLAPASRPSRLPGPQRRAEAASVRAVRPGSKRLTVPGLIFLGCEAG